MKNTDPIYAGDYESVPEGKYEAIVIRIERGEFYRRKKLYIWFQIVEQGNENGKEVFMPFNMYKRITRGSKYYAAWLIANKSQKPKKNDRMSPKIFKGKVFSIKVRTVITGSKNDVLTGGEKYSVVDEILELCVG
jgi:hypothetical protein